MTDLSTVAADLRWIEQAASRLEERAVDSRGEVVGGEAMVNLAPIARPREWNENYEAREWRHEANPDRYAAPDTLDEDPNELWPAVQILTWWSEDYRSRLGYLHDDWRPTLESEAKFLRNADVAEWIWCNEPAWDDYAADVRRARAKLETVLVEGERPDRTRVVCAFCEVDPPRLIVRYSADPDGDTWKCPRCKHVYDTAGFRNAHAKQLRSEAAEKYVPLADAIGTLRAQGRPERTIRKWLAPDEDGKAAVLSYCEVSTRRTWIYWPDLWRLHLTTPTRKRDVA